MHIFRSIFLLPVETSSSKRWIALGLVIEDADRIVEER